MKIRVMSIFGTRPEAIKMCPLVKELGKHEEIENIVCLTGQHREMLQQVIDIFGTDVKYNLDIMQPQQTLTTITTSILGASGHCTCTWRHIHIVCCCSGSFLPKNSGWACGGWITYF